MSTLVIVESPTKARTIRNFLPQGYRVEASMGHVRDLPESASEVPAAYKGEKWSQLGVNVDDDFNPLYVVPKDKQKVVKALKDALKDADELLLATDEDREGESISWHLLEVLKPKVPVRRMVFHEITEEAIEQALNNCRQIDNQLVHAQETRRILDRLVGYTVSPLLWKKIAFGLSAGRVQSVSVRLLVQRERERRAFRPGSYWDLKATLVAATASGPVPFSAQMITLGGRRLATGSDFDAHTGHIAAGREVVLLNEAEATDLRDRLWDQPWQVTSLEERPSTRKPSAPFTTSTLQQEANRKLRLSARETMRIAQSLYEQGYITYMRTDSVHLSAQAIAAARSCVEQMYGPEYLSPEPRQYTTKSKNAQEAHEAIRPAGHTFRTPQETGLSGREFDLYDLIWKRTIATQMAEARQTHVTVQLQVGDAGFRATGKRIDFPGFFRAYVEGSDDPEAALENQEVILPPLRQGDQPTCQELVVIGHQTQPPARYTEALLVKTLEQEGIGRPSTYATIIGTIIDRGYAQIVNNTLVPTFTAFAVTALLEKYFPDLVDPGFTARMEQTLDEISTGEAEWLPYLREFYLGETGLENQVREREKQIDASEARTVALDDLAAKVRIGRFGPYLEVEEGNEVVTASIPKDVMPADLNQEQVQLLLRQKTAGPDKLGFHPETGEPIYRLVGTYGPYVQLGDISDANPKPKRASLPKGMKLEEITLEDAIGLLSLPRLLGVHPETGAKVQAGLGRFGPYVVHDQGKAGKDYRSLKAGDDVLTITLDRALELLAEPKSQRGRRAASSKPPLRELGVHPDDEEPITVHEGPYGLYVKHGKTNARLPEGETVESLTLESALALLAEKQGKKKARTSTKAASKSTTTKAASTKAASTKAASTKAASTKAASTKAASTKAASKSTAGKSTQAKSTAQKSTAQKSTAQKSTAQKSTAQKSTKAKSTHQKATTPEGNPVSGG